MVISNKALFEWKSQESRFYNKKDIDFETRILQNYTYMQRWIAETNFDFKQPIWYGVVLNQKNEIFVYKRWWTSSNAGEKRLHDKIAFWVWWHIEKEDENLENPLTDSLVREIEEELNITKQNINSVENIWYINDETNEVWKVHFWVVYVLKITNDNFALLDWELDNGEFIDILKLENMIYSWDYDVENWSKILFEPIKKYLK